MVYGSQLGRHSPDHSTLNGGIHLKQIFVVITITFIINIITFIVSVIVIIILTIITLSQTLLSSLSSLLLFLSSSLSSLPVSLAESLSLTLLHTRTNYPVSHYENEYPRIYNGVGMIKLHSFASHYSVSECTHRLMSNVRVLVFGLLSHIADAHHVTLPRFAQQHRVLLLSKWNQRIGDLPISIGQIRNCICCAI